MKTRKLLIPLIISILFSTVPLSSLGNSNHVFLYNTMQNPKYNTSNGYSITATNFQNNSLCIQKKIYKINETLHQSPSQKFCSKMTQHSLLSSTLKDIEVSALGRGDDGTVIVTIPFDSYRELFGKQQGNRSMQANSIKEAQNSPSGYQPPIRSDLQNTQASTNLESPRPLFSTNANDFLTTTSFSTPLSSPANPVNATLFSFQTFKFLPLPPTNNMPSQSPSATVSAPEPTTWILFGTSLILLTLCRHVRNRKNPQEN